MSEKRYDIVNETCNRLVQLLCLVGVKLEYFKYFIKDTKENKYLTVSDTIDLLNEQQATNDYHEESNSRLQIQLGEILRLVDEQQATIEQLKQSQDVKEFSALFNQSIALQREIKELKEENEQLKKRIIIVQK